MLDKKAAINKAKELKSICLNCKACSLGEDDILDGFNPHVYATGNVAAKIVCCAEAPGFDETRLGKPLIGRSGNIFTKHILGGLGLERDDVWITNTVLCRPPGNIKPTKEQIECCSPHLLAQFEFIKPKLVIIMGATPMSVFLGIDSGITKLAGTIQHSKKFDVDIFVSLHPSFIARTGQYDLLDKHVGVLKEYCEGI